MTGTQATELLLAGVLVFVLLFVWYDGRKA